MFDNEEVNDYVLLVLMTLYFIAVAIGYIITEFRRGESNG